jgi:hypothetical protein
MRTPYQTVWTPPAQMMDHNGVLIHPDTFFFASPPPEIGAVISASGAGITDALNSSSKPPTSSEIGAVISASGAGITDALNSSSKPPTSSRSIFSDWGVALAVLVFSFFVFVLAVLSFFVIGIGILVRNMLSASGAGSIWAWLGGGSVTMLLSWFYIAGLRDRYFPRTECSFIGELGVAHYWRTRKGVKGEVLRFSETTGLRKSVTQCYKNGVYQGVSFNYTWNNQSFLSDQPTMSHPFSIQGWSENGKLNDAYFFAQAAERVWTAIRLQRAQTELARLGVARFSTAKDIDLEVGSGFINVVFRNREPERIEAQELELTTGNGDLAIRRKTDGLSSGRFNPLAFVNVVFQADEIKDLDAFLRLVNTIVLQKS